ncbi:MAG: thioredoxin family protein [Helicobacteraceae bacterium]|nr:thioredoxin family protein [Helicobacteraceae bacterium]
MNIEAIEQTLDSELAVALYFSAPTCNVCHALKPKLLAAFETNLPLLQVISVDISETPQIASNFSVFTIPTLLIYLDGKEFLRKSRHMSVDQVIEEIKRPYDMMTS